MRSSRPLTAVLGLVFFALSAVPAWALPQPKLPPEATDKPSVVVRVRPVDELLKDSLAVAKLVDQEATFESANTFLGPILGAIDTSKPIGFYAQIRPEPTNSVGILMIPVKNEKDLVDLIGKLGGNFGITVNEEKGLYTVAVPGPFPVLFRFHGGYAYATVANTDEAEKAIAKNKIYAPAQLFAAKDDSLVSVTFNLDAIPNALKKKALDHIDEFLAKSTDRAANEPPVTRDAKVAVVTELAKKAQMLVADSLTLKIHFDFDRTKETMGTSLRLVARKDTALANEIARNTTGQGSGQGLLGSPSAVKLAVLASAPDSLKATLNPLVDKVLAGLVQKAEALQADAKDLADAVAPTLKAGNLDLGVDLRGPDSNGLATLLVGVRLVDGAKVDASVRRLLGNIGAKDRKKVEFDVAKAGGASIHRIPVDNLDHDAQEMFGDDAKVYFAVRKDLLLVGLGSEKSTLPIMKEALESSPRTTKALEGQVAIRNLAKLLEKKQPGTVAAADKAYPKGTDDLIRYSITGGDAVEARVSSSIRIILFGMLAEQAKNR
jgi:hypothetical protein